MVQFVWGDPDAEKIHEGLIIVVDAIGTVGKTGEETNAMVRAIYEEIMKSVPASPVPALLADIIARLERIEARLG